MRNGTNENKMSNAESQRAGDSAKKRAPAGRECGTEQNLNKLFVY